MSYCMNCTDKTVSSPVNRYVHSSKQIATKKGSYLNREPSKMNLIKIIFNSIYKTKRKCVLLFMIIFTTGLKLVGETVFPNGYEDCYLLSVSCKGAVTSGRCVQNFNSNQVVSSAPMKNPDDVGFKQSEKSKCGIVWVFGFPTKRACGGPNAIDQCERPSYL